MNPTCGCCEGTEILTPLTTANRPGLPALVYRAGTHATFLQTMQARLSNLCLEIPGESLSEQGRRQLSRIYPLRDLKTRDASDPAIALLDSWAVVGDVLTFYQERIANEGYLRTATERRSVLELARLIGYTLRPGVASTVYPAYTLEEDRSVNPPKPTAVTLPKGSRLQSIPGPGELPQSFETSDDLEARSEWNGLKPRLTQPQKITLDHAQQITKVYLAGTGLNLKSNDRLLFVFGDKVGEQVMRSVQEAEEQFDEKRTEATLQAVPFLVTTAVALLRTAQAALDKQIIALGSTPADANLVQWMERMRDLILKVTENLVLGNYPPIDPACFSHDRIYSFPAGGASPAGVIAGLPREEINRLFSRQPRPGARRRAAATAPAENFWQDPHVMEAAGAVLDRLSAMMHDGSFQQTLACFARSVLQQARPASASDRNVILDLLSRATEKKLFARFHDLIGQLHEPQTDPALERLRGKALALLEQFALLLRFTELHDGLAELLADLLKVAGDKAEALGSAIEFLQAAIRWLEAIPRSASAGCESSLATTAVERLITPLAIRPSLQPASSARLARTASDAFTRRADTLPQLLTVLEPRLRETLYAAWSNAIVNSSPPPLRSVHVLRLAAQPFGYNAPVKMALRPNEDKSMKERFPFVAQPDGDWKPSEPGDERPERLYLDAGYDAIVSPGWLVIQDGTASSLAARVEGALIRPRTAYGLSTKTTQLALSRAWWKPATDTMEKLRGTTVYAQSQELSLAEKPFTADLQGDRIELNELYDGLRSGRWLIVSGERTDVPSTTGVKAAELVMLSAVVQEFDKELPGDKTRTTLIIANKLAYRYKRDTVTLYGNVMKATHGETRNEVLGSGDGSKPMQAFTLKQAPLTFVSAPVPAGVESTLQVRVNDVAWRETDTLAGLLPADRKFITTTDDDGKTTVVFGNGQRGARPPTGQENVTAVYRNGIGKPGNVKAGQISLLVTRPLHVKEVINPLPATGGADRESRDQARENAPLAVTALDRLVSTQDYADFARTFAGIGKASAARLSDGRRQVVHVTLAGADDIPIDEHSDLFANLRRALRDFGDPSQPIQVEVRKLKLLVIQAKVRLLPDYLWEKVEPKVRAALLDRFSFARRDLGQDAVRSEAISAIQAVEGVQFVDVDAFDAVDEEQIVDQLAGSKTLVLENRERIPVGLDRVDLNNHIQAAELACVSPDVTDTIILSEITQ